MPASRSSGKGRGATINIVLPSAAPSGIAGGLGLPPSPIGAGAPSPARPPVAPPMRPQPSLSAPPAPPAMKRGGRVLAGAGSGLGRLQKSGR